MIQSTKCAIFSDIHIGVHRDSDTWHRISIDWAKWYRDLLQSRGIKDIIFCGDFFHYRDSIATNTLFHAANVLNILKDFNIVFIPGNHDCYYKDTSDINSLSILNGRDNLTVIEKIYTHNTSSGRKIAFAPWGTGIGEIPECDILFGHFEIETFKLNNYKICDHGISSDDIYNKSPLTISGHFHLRSERIIDDRTILYVGNPFQMDFGDLGDKKGVYFIDLETGKYDFVENNISPKFQKVILSEMVDSRYSVDTLNRLIKDNIVKLIIDRKISTKDADYLFKQIRALQPRVLDIEHDINFNSIIQDDDCRDFSGVDIEQAISEFINIMEITNKEPVTNYVLDLYKRSLQSV